MAKKNTPKKISRKTMRIIRKTLGAICLIMALIVAAIPTGQASAIGGSATDTTPDPLTYATSDYDETDMDWLDISKLSGVNAKKGYTIRE